MWSYLPFCGVISLFYIGVISLFYIGVISLFILDNSTKREITPI
jgi:hypothetical protein